MAVAFFKISVIKIRALMKYGKVQGKLAVFTKFSRS